MGDGECAEGGVWEAASLAGIYQLNNLVAVVDVNRLGQSQPTAFEHNWAFTRGGLSLRLAERRKSRAMTSKSCWKCSRQWPWAISRW